MFQAVLQEGQLLSIYRNPRRACAYPETPNRQKDADNEADDQNQKWKHYTLTAWPEATEARSTLGWFSLAVQFDFALLKFKLSHSLLEIQVPLALFQFQLRPPLELMFYPEINVPAWLAVGYVEKEARKQNLMPTTRTFCSSQ